MSKPKKTAMLLVLVISALAAAQIKEQAPKPRPAPEMQRVAKMLVGAWNIEEDFAPGGSRPKGGKGTGQSVIRLGPGGFSVIEDLNQAVRTEGLTICLAFVGGTKLLKA
jgi:hypothetical protein